MTVSVRLTEADLLVAVSLLLERKGYTVKTVRFGYDRPPYPTPADPGTGCYADAECLESSTDKR